MAWFLKAITSARKGSVCSSLVNGRKVALLSEEEIAYAELFILRKVQRAAFPEINISLQKGEAPKHKEIAKLQDRRPVWDSRKELIRVTGRIAKWFGVQKVNPPILLRTIIMPSTSSSCSTTSKESMLGCKACFLHSFFIKFLKRNPLDRPNTTKGKRNNQ